MARKKVWLSTAVKMHMVIIHFLDPSLFLLDDIYFVKWLFRSGRWNVVAYFHRDVSHVYVYTWVK